MKFLRNISLACVVMFGFMIGYTNGASWGSQGSDPKQILESVHKNSGNTKTALDDISGDNVSTVLDSISDKVGPYIDWGIFIGLSVAVLLLVYNGITLITSPMNEGAAGKVKTRIIYIISGILVLTGFYFIIKVILSVVENVAK